MLWNHNLPLHELFVYGFPILNLCRLWMNKTCTRTWRQYEQALWETLDSVLCLFWSRTGHIWRLFLRASPLESRSVRGLDSSYQIIVHRRAWIMLYLWSEPRLDSFEEQIWLGSQEVWSWGRRAGFWCILKMSPLGGKIFYGLPDQH